MGRKIRLLQVINERLRDPASQGPALIPAAQTWLLVAACHLSFPASLLPGEKVGLGLFVRVGTWGGAGRGRVDRGDSKQLRDSQDAQIGGRSRLKAKQQSCLQVPADSR